MLDTEIYWNVSFGASERQIGLDDPLARIHKACEGLITRRCHVLHLADFNPLNTDIQYKKYMEIYSVPPLSC